MKKCRFKKQCRLGDIKKDGSENISSKPTELRAKIIAPVTLRQKMNSMWKEFREKEEANLQIESLQDAQDFDVDNDVFPRSQYEVDHELSDHMEQQYLEAEEAALAQHEAPAAPAEELPQNPEQPPKQGEKDA